MVLAAAYVVMALGLNIIVGFAGLLDLGYVADVLFDLPGKVGLAFDLSAISSGIYGAFLVVVMLLRPQGLVPASTA
jgi:ABC-type branched-subunit amino acid transport system permease subunit